MSKFLGQQKFDAAINIHRYKRIPKNSDQGVRISGWNRPPTKRMNESQSRNPRWATPQPNPEEQPLHRSNSSSSAIPMIFSCSIGKRCLRSPQNQFSSSFFVIVISRCSTGRSQTAVFATGRSCVVGTGSAPWNSHRSSLTGRTWRHAWSPPAAVCCWTSPPTCPCSHPPS